LSLRVKWTTPRGLILGLNWLAPSRGWASPIEKGRACARPEVQEEQTQRPKLADCMDCRDRSEVEAMPCIRSLNSSAFEALSRAVS
jgi:hypothetical protein